MEILDPLVKEKVFNLLLDVFQGLHVSRVFVNLLNIILLILNWFPLFGLFKDPLRVSTKHIGLLVVVAVLFFVIMEHKLEGSHCCVHV